MARLTTPEKRQVVQRLAAFETPTEVVQWAAEDLEKQLSHEQVSYYDPTRGSRHSPKWEELFYEAREEFLNDLDTIPLSHRAVRLRELTDLYERAKEQEEVEKAARMLKQAAKEVGEKFTNVERKEHSGPDGEAMQMQWVDPESVDDADAEDQ